MASSGEVLSLGGEEGGSDMLGKTGVVTLGAQVPVDVDDGKEEYFGI